MRTRAEALRERKTGTDPSALPPVPPPPSPPPSVPSTPDDNPGYHGEQKGEPPAPLPPLFQSAHAPPKTSVEFDRITETIFAQDVLKQYDRLERELTIGEGRSDYATVLRHLDKAEDNARLAHKLYLAAKIEREAWEIEADITRAGMWSSAQSDLEREKEAGIRKKQITDKDVEYHCTVKFPDEWKALAMKARKVKGTEYHLEHLTELWKGRCRTLQTILATMRK